MHPTKTNTHFDRPVINVSNEKGVNYTIIVYGMYDNIMEKRDQSGVEVE